MKISEEQANSTILKIRKYFKSISREFNIDIHSSCKNIGKTNKGKLMEFRCMYFCNLDQNIKLQIEVDVLKEMFYFQYYYFNYIDGIWKELGVMNLVGGDIRCLYNSLKVEITNFIKNKINNNGLILSAIYELSNEFKGSNVILQGNSYILEIPSILNMMLESTGCEVLKITLQNYSKSLNKVNIIKSEINTYENNIDKICNELRILIINNI